MSKPDQLLPGQKCHGTSGYDSRNILQRSLNHTAHNDKIKHKRHRRGGGETSGPMFLCLIFLNRKLNKFLSTAKWNRVSRADGRDGSCSWNAVWLRGTASERKKATSSRARTVHILQYAAADEVFCICVCVCGMESKEST